MGLKLHKLPGYTGCSSCGAAGGREGPAAQFETPKLPYLPQFNFGPRSDVNQNVLKLVNEFSKYWDSGEWVISENLAKPEAGLLKLNCDKANAKLNWNAILSFEDSVRLTGEWYKAYFENKQDMYQYTNKQISEYSTIANKKGLCWT